MHRQYAPSMINLLIRLWVHISPRRRLMLCCLFVLMLFASFAELASIGAVIPFLGVLTSPNWLFENPLAQPLIKLLGYTEPSHLLKPLTVLFVTAAIVSGGMRLLLNWAQTRLGHAIGADFSARIYRHTLYQPYLVHLMRNSSVVISGITNKADGLVNQSLLPTFVITSSMMMLISILIALITFQPIVSVIAIVGFGGIRKPCKDCGSVVKSAPKKMGRPKQNKE